MFPRCGRFLPPHSACRLAFAPVPSQSRTRAFISPSLCSAGPLPSPGERRHSVHSPRTRRPRAPSTRRPAGPALWTALAFSWVWSQAPTFVLMLKPGGRLRLQLCSHRADGSLSTAWSLLLDSQAVEEGRWFGRPPRLRSCHLLHEELLSFMLQRTE